MTMHTSSPFCGNSAKLRFTHHRSGRETYRVIGQVRCLSCGARGPAVSSQSMDWRDGLTEEALAKMEREAFRRFAARSDTPTDTSDLPLFNPN